MAYFLFLNQLSFGVHFRLDEADNLFQEENKSTKKRALLKNKLTPKKVTIGSWNKFV